MEEPEDDGESKPKCLLTKTHTHTLHYVYMYSYVMRTYFTRLVCTYYVRLFRVSLGILARVKMVVERERWSWRVNFVFWPFLVWYSLYVDVLIRLVIFELHFFFRVFRNEKILIWKMILIFDVILLYNNF